MGSHSPSGCLAQSAVADPAGWELTLGPFTPQNSTGVGLHLPKFWVAGGNPYTNLDEGLGVLCGPHVEGSWQHDPVAGCTSHAGSLLCRGPKASSLVGSSPSLGPGQAPASSCSVLTTKPWLPTHTSTLGEGAGQDPASPSASCGTCVLSSEMGHLESPTQLPSEALGTRPLSRRPERGQHSLCSGRGRVGSTTWALICRHPALRTACLRCGRPGSQ